MRIALITDVYPPTRTSGAVHIRDLSDEFVAQGQAVIVLVPDAKSHRQEVCKWVSGGGPLRLMSHITFHAS